VNEEDKAPAFRKAQAVPSDDVTRSQVAVVLIVLGTVAEAAGVAVSLGIAAMCAIIGAQIVAIGVLAGVTTGR
jgi:hypothetical protein